MVAVVVIAGCASQSAKEKWIASTDNRCDDMTKRFTGELAWGDSIGRDDVDKMEERVTLIRDLQKHAREHPPPEVSRRDLDDWLNKLGAYAEDTQEMHSDYSRVQPGSPTDLVQTAPPTDLVLAMSAAAVQRAAEESKPAAQHLGLHKCTANGPLGEAELTIPREGGHDRAAEFPRPWHAILKRHSRRGARGSEWPTDEGKRQPRSSRSVEPPARRPRRARLSRIGGRAIRSSARCSTKNVAA